jgi:tRNA U55 pseudouridine synthase TruB
VTVHSLSLVDFNPPFFTIRVRTDGGLYVRTLLKVPHPDRLCSLLQLCG